MAADRTARAAPANDDEALSEALRFLVIRLRKVADQQLGAKGSSYARTKWLMYLEANGPVRSVDLVGALRLAPRTVTVALDALERDGLVRRMPDPNDRRIKLISVTPAGDAVIQATRPMLKGIFDNAFSGLTREERAQLAVLLGRIADRVDAMAAAFADGEDAEASSPWDEEDART